MIQTVTQQILMPTLVGPTTYESPSGLLQQSSVHWVSPIVGSDEEHLMDAEEDNLLRRVMFVMDLVRE